MAHLNLGLEVLADDSHLLGASSPFRNARRRQFAKMLEIAKRAMKECTVEDCREAIKRSSWATTHICTLDPNQFDKAYEACKKSIIAFRKLAQNKPDRTEINQSGKDTGKAANANKPWVSGAIVAALFAPIGVVVWGIHQGLTHRLDNLGWTGDRLKSALPKMVEILKFIAEECEQLDIDPDAYKAADKSKVRKGMRGLVRAADTMCTDLLYCINKVKHFV